VVLQFQGLLILTLQSTPSFSCPALSVDLPILYWSQPSGFRRFEPCAC